MVPPFFELEVQTSGKRFERKGVENGMKPQTLKAILGHSSLAMTMDLYAHVLPTTKAEEMNMIAGAF